MEYLYTICIGLLAFFSFSLLTKKNKALSERVFSLWIILLVVTVVTFLIYIKGQSRQYPTLITLICDSHLLHGSFLYMYVLSFTTPRFRLKWMHAWHLLPLAVQVVYKLYLNYVVGEMQCYGEGGCNEENNIYVVITNIYKYVILGTYVVLTWKQVTNYKANAKSPRDQMRYSWVHQIMVGVTFLYFGVLLLQVGRELWPMLFWERMLLGNTLVTLFIFVFLYMGNSYAYLFVSPSKSRFKNLSESFNPNACKQNIPVDEMKIIFDRINDYMNTEQAYLKGHLTLKDMSEMIQISAVSISQAVNKYTGGSITDYINGFRVELLKQKLMDDANKNYKILVLAEECGFTSKSTMMRAFKQKTGITPGEFLKRSKHFN